MIKKSYTSGIILIFTGVLFLLFNLNILTLNLLLLILSISFLTFYLVRQSTSYLIAGSILLAISIVNIIDEYVLISIDIRNIVFLWAIGIISLVMYYKHRTRGYLIFGLILPAVGIYDLVEKLSYTSVYWVFFLLLAIVFYTIYRVEYSQFGVVWAKTLAKLLIVLSFILLLSSQNLLQFRFWKTVSYLWPILLIIAGLRVIYNMVQLRK